VEVNGPSTLLTRFAEELRRVAPSFFFSTRGLGGVTKGWRLDVFRIGVVFDRVAGFLAFVVYFVFLHVALIDVLGGHAEGLGQ